MSSPHNIDDYQKKKLLRYFADVYGLDLGTTKFCLSALKIDQSGNVMDAFRSVSVSAGGMKRGMLSDIVEAKAALIKSIELGEREFSNDIKKVVVGIAGSHLQSRTVSARINLYKRPVSHAELKELLDRVEAQYSSFTREILHTIPIGYRIDNRPVVENPLGLRGETLEGEFFLIDADKSYLKDVVEVCNGSGLEVIKLYSEPFASASVTVPDEFKRIGCSVIDVGGGTSDGIVFVSGRPINLYTINVAGKMMTNDLAIGLATTFDEAERIKQHFGLSADYINDLSVVDLHGNIKLIKAEDVRRILLPRIHELGVHIARYLLPYKGTLGAGILLTGGGSDVRGICEYYTSKMGIPVRKAYPQVGIEHNIFSERMGKRQPSQLATVMGLLNLELGRWSQQQDSTKFHWSSRYLAPFINWIRELS